MKFRKICNVFLSLLLILMISVPVAFASSTIEESTIVEEGLIHPYVQMPDESQWASGQLSVHQSTHQFITDKAIAIFVRDFGSFPLSGYTSTLRVASDWPDTEEEESSGLFKGHFYDPDTQKNYRGETSPTARTKLVSWYNQAVSAYKAGNKTTAMQCLGRALHYAEDLSTPHHAANKIAYASYHKEYEQWVQEHQTNYIEQNASSATYTWAKKTSVSDMGHNFAVNAKALINDADSGIESRYATATATALPKAQRNTVAILYKFCVDVGLK